MIWLVRVRDRVPVSIRASKPVCHQKLPSQNKAAEKTINGQAKSPIPMPALAIVLWVDSSFPTFWDRKPRLMASALITIENIIEKRKNRIA